MVVTQYAARKRFFDLAVVLMMAPLWGPILFAALLVTAIWAGRPVLFSQIRMGHHCLPVRVFKIRTMSSDIAAPDRALFAGWTYADDPRVTSLGRVLRRYRLDELPQIWNILRGEMSLVGPRPEPWDIAISLGKMIPDYHRRHDVLPGLTGLCQISPAYYDFGTVEKSAHKLQIDLTYVRAHSLRTDFFILMRTVPTLLRQRGMA